MDYDSYVQIFNNYKNNINIGIPNEFGYKWLLNITKYISGEQQLIFLFFAIVSNILIYKYIFENSKYRELSIFIYTCLGTFYFSSFNGIRQFCAIALFSYSLKFVKKRNRNKYFIIIILGAFLFHYTLFLMLPFYYLLNINIQKKYMLFILILELLLYRSILLLVSLSIYSTYLSKTFSTKPGIFLYVYILFSVILLIFNNKETEEKKLFFNMIFYSMCVILLMLIDNSFAAQLVLRINSYFFIIIIVLIPNIIKEIKNRYIRNIIIVSLYMFLFVYFIRSVYITGYSYKIFPYHINFKLF